MRTSGAGWCAWLLLLAIVETTCLAAIYWRYQSEIMDVDGVTTALVARNVFEGKGYTTPLLSLYEANIYAREGRLSEGPPWPNTMRFPLPVFTRQVYFSLFGVTLFTAYFLDSLLFHFLAAILLFAAARIFWEDPVAAFLAGFLFIVHPQLITTAVRGSNYSLEMCLFLGFLIVVVRWVETEKGKVLWGVALGGIIGAGFLNRYSSGVFWALMVAVLWVWLGGRRRSWRTRDALTVTIPAVVLVIPLFVWNYRTFGTPFYFNQGGLQWIHLTALARGMNPWWQLSYVVDPRELLQVLVIDWSGLLKKAVSFATDDVVKLLTLHGFPWPWIFAGAAVHAIARDGQPSLQRRVSMLVVVLSGVAVLQLSSLPFLGGGINYFWYVFTGVYLLAGYGLVITVRRVPGFWLSSELRAALGGRENRPALWALAGLGLSIVSAFVWMARREIPLAYFIAGVTASVAVGLAPSMVAWLRHWPGEHASRVMRLGMVMGICFLGGYVLLVSHYVGEWAPGRSFEYDWKSEWNEGWLKEAIRELPPGIVLAMSPWKVAWFTRRPVLPLPNDPADIDVLEKKHGLPIAGLLLEPVTAQFLFDTGAPSTFFGYDLARRQGTMPGFRTVGVDHLRLGARFLMARIRERSHLSANTADVPVYWLYRADLDRSGWAAVANVREDDAYPRVTKAGDIRRIRRDAEMSFFLEAASPCTLSVRFASPEQVVSLAVNANRLWLGEIGQGLGPFRVTADAPLVVKFEASLLRDGINRIAVQVDAIRSLEQAFEPEVWISESRLQCGDGL
jgi:hypothetical protein